VTRTPSPRSGIRGQAKWVGKTSDSLSIPTHDGTGAMRRWRGADPRSPSGIVSAAAQSAAWALSLGLVLGGAGSARIAPSGLAYSSASAHVVQMQPAPGACQARGAGVFERPDPRCTPGAVNPAVTQVSIYSTICRRGWTSTVRPSVSITDPEKFASMAAYRLRGTPSRYEYDHLVPLELGGAVNDPRNLWPEPNYTSATGFYKNPKDRLESVLRRLVCDGSMRLSQAQRIIAGNWVSAYHAYG
jgi:hypothetical protein